MMMSGNMQECLIEPLVRQMVVMTAWTWTVL